jgi:hypothetical protein
MDQLKISHSSSEEKPDSLQEWWEDLFIYEYLDHHEFERDSRA